jgi:hypothetical protein
LCINGLSICRYCSIAYAYLGKSPRGGGEDKGGKVEEEKGADVKEKQERRKTKRKMYKYIEKRENNGEKRCCEDVKTMTS